VFIGIIIVTSQTVSSPLVVVELSSVVINIGLAIESRVHGKAIEQSAELLEPIVTIAGIPSSSRKVS